MSLEPVSPVARPPRVLVLLATHDGANHLGAQLASIAAQQGVEINVLASDDGSSDCTLHLLNTAPLILSLRTLPPWPGAGSAAGNFYRLIRECDAKNFDVVAFADQDDIWYPDKLKRAYDRLLVTGASGYSAAVRAFWPDGRTRTLRQSSRTSQGDFLFEGAGQGCTFVLACETFLLIQAFVRLEPELIAAAHFHDWLVYAFCRSTGRNWVFDPKPALDYRQHENNVHGASGGLAATVRRVRLIRDGWYTAEIDAIYRLARAASPANRELDAFARARSRAGACPGRLQWLGYLSTQSRRRLTDRVVLVLAALFGLI